MATIATIASPWHVIFASKDLLWKHLERIDRDALRCTCRDTRDAMDTLVETAVLEVPMRFRGLAWNEDPDAHLAHRARYHRRLPLLRTLRVVWNPLVFQSPAIAEVFQYRQLVGGERCQNIKVCDIVTPQPPSPTTMAMHFDLALALSVLVPSAEEIKIDCEIESFACVSIFANTCASLRCIDVARPLCLFQLPLDHTLKLTRLVLKERLSGSILRRMSHRAPGLEHLTLTTTGALDIGRLSFAAPPVPPLALPALHTLVLVDLPVSLSVADWLAASLPALKAGPVIGQITAACLLRSYSERGSDLIPKLLRDAEPGSCSYAAPDASLHELLALPAPILSAMQQDGVMNARPVGSIRINALARHETGVGLAAHALCQGSRNFNDMFFGLKIEFVFYDRVGGEDLACVPALSKIVAKLALHTKAAQVMLHGYLETAAQGGPEVLAWLAEAAVEMCMCGIPFKFC